LKRSILHLRKNRLYLSLLRKFGIEIDQIVEKMWTIVLSGGSDDFIYESSIIEEVRALQNVIKSYAFSLRTHLPELEELFFSLTKAHRDSLEYLGVFAAKLDMDYCKNSGEEGIILSQLAGIFAPYLMRPSAWTNASAQDKKKAKFLQQKFLLLFFYFLKKKHNLLTKLERIEIERSDEEMLENLLMSNLPSSTLSALLSEAMDFSHSKTENSVRRTPSSSPTTSVSTPKEFDVFPPNSEPIQPANGKYKEILLDNLKIKALPLDTNLNFSSLPDPEQKDSMKLTFKNLLIADWDLSREEQNIKQTFLEEVIDVERWVDPGGLGIHVPKPFHEIVKTMKTYQSKYFGKVEKETLPENPDKSKNMQSDCPGRGILHLLSENNVNNNGTTNGINNNSNNDSSASTADEEAGITAANYDYAMTFPRTVASIADRTSTETLRSTDRQSVRYQYDTQIGLFNHTKPALRDSAVCEICSVGFSKMFAKKWKVHCAYCGRVLCASCCQKVFVIPSEIVQNGNLTPQEVCNDCENHLQSNIKRPMLELSLFTKSAVESLGKKRILELQKTRKNLMRYIYFYLLPDCPTTTRILSRVSNQMTNILMTSPFGSGPLLSLADVMELKTTRYLATFQELENTCYTHVQQCPHCSNVKRCCTAGKLCNQKSNHISPEELDGLDFNGVQLCNECKLYCHVSCWIMDLNTCLRCETESNKRRADSRAQKAKEKEKAKENEKEKEKKKEEQKDEEKANK